MRSKQGTFQFNTSIAFPISALILLVFVLLGINFWQSVDDRMPVNTVANVLPNPKKINNFQLVTSDNKQLSTTNLTAHWTLLYFGYTRSNSISPNTLSLLNRIYNMLQTDYPTLQVMFVSLDPERDTLNEIKDFTASFNKNFIGATGTSDELQELENQLGIQLKRTSSAANVDNYQISYTNTILLINPDAKLQATFPANAKPDEARLAFEEMVRNHLS
jgi:protein SCO1/2